MSLHEQDIRHAHATGYRVTSDGLVLNPVGRARVTVQNRYGYHYFSITRPLKGSGKVYVHKLHAFQLYGEDSFKPGIEVRHLDDRKDNNRDTNLLLGTRSQNIRDRVRNGCHKRQSHLPQLRAA